MLILSFVLGSLTVLISLCIGIGSGAYLYYSGQMGNPPLKILTSKEKHKVRPPKED